MPSGFISFDEFVQRVRRYRRKDVLEAVARASSNLSNGLLQDPPIKPTYPVGQFSLAAVAKAAIISGNEFRSAPLTPASLSHLCHSLISVEEPILAKANSPIDTDSFLVRTTFGAGSVGKTV